VRGKVVYEGCFFGLCVLSVYLGPATVWSITGFWEDLAGLGRSLAGDVFCIISVSENGTQVFTNKAYLGFQLCLTRDAVEVVRHVANVSSVACACSGLSQCSGDVVSWDLES